MLFGANDLNSFYLYRDSLSYKWPNSLGNGKLEDVIEDIPREMCVCVLKKIEYGKISTGMDVIMLNMMIVKADTKFSAYDIGERIDLTDEDFGFSGTFMKLANRDGELVFDLATPGSIFGKKNEAVCVKCGTKNPYAEWSIDFKCWGCKNGY